MLSLTGCNKKNKIPGNIIPPKKMEAVLWDMMRADYFLTDYILQKDLSQDKKTESIKLYRQVFSLHNISKEQFTESFSYYQSHPAIFKNIMDSLSHPKKVSPEELILKPIDSDSQIQQKKNTIDSASPIRKKKIIRTN
ncbi:MAG: DUF4296 domain-containing protein [Chitinophagaceae bacterium]